MYIPITSTSQLPLVGAAYETAFFDMKGNITKTLPKSIPTAYNAFEMAKDAAAFASSMGGTVLVGASEDASTHILKGYAPLTKQHALDLGNEYSQAINQRCRPVPIISYDIIANPAGTGYVLAVNVEPFPTQLVAVRVSGDKEDGHGGHAYVFPIRVGVHTTLLFPEQLPMYMQSESRRAAILLGKLPQGTGEFIFTRGGSRHQFTIEQIDLQADSLLLRSQSGATICVPLGAIQFVWQDATDKKWLVTVDGRLDASQSRIGFLPGWT